jgi:alpha-D-ribose 1-methylphosphonate 5-triphosphate synthase subunit PhnH
MKKLHSFDEVFDGQKVFRKVLEAMSNPVEGSPLQSSQKRCIAM